MWPQTAPGWPLRAERGRAHPLACRALGGPYSVASGLPGNSCASAPLGLPFARYQSIGITGRNAMQKAVRIAGGCVAACALVGIGAAIGSGSGAASGSARPAVTKTVAVPGPTVTVSAAPKVTRAPAAGATMPGDGTFIVGYAAGDWRPGTWQSGTPSSGNCYSATLSNLTGAGLSSGIINNNNSTGPSVMTVTHSVKGVQVSGCATWHRL